MSLREKSYTSYIKQFLKDTAEKVVSAVRSDQLIKVMGLQQTSEAFILQRVNQIVDIVYKQDRQKLIENLIDQNNKLKGRITNFDEQNLQMRRQSNQQSSKLEKQKSAIQLQRSEMEDKLKLAKAHSLQLQQKLLSNKRDYQAKDSQIRSSKHRILQLEDNQRRYKDQIKNLEMQIDGLNSQLMSIKRQRSQKKTSMVDQGRLMNLQRQNDLLQQRIYKVDSQAKSAQMRQQKLQNQYDALKHELDMANRNGQNQIRQIQLVQLKDDISEKKNKIKSLKQYIKQKDIQIQDLHDAVRNLQRKVRQAAHSYNSNIKSLQTQNHQNAVRMRKDHKLQLEQLDKYHNKQRKQLTESNQDALQSLVKIHRQQLQRAKRQSQYRQKSLNQKCAAYQKRCQGLQQAISQSNSKAQLARHPRFSIQELARAQQQLSIKDTTILRIQNDKIAALNELQRAVSQRNNYSNQNKRLKQQIQTIASQYEKSLLQISGMDQIKTNKSIEKQNAFQNQIHNLICQNQKLWNDIKLYQNRYQNTLLQNHSLGLRQKGLTFKQVEANQQILKVSNQNETLKEQIRSIELRNADLQKQVSVIPFYSQKANLLDQLQQKVHLLELQKNQLTQRNQILKVDFDQIARQLRQSHLSNKSQLNQIQGLKSQLIKYNGIVQHIRDTSNRNYQQLQNKRQILKVQMQRTINQLVINFKNQKDAMLNSFSSYQKRMKSQIAELSNFICSKYQYLLESCDLQRQREKQILISNIQTQANNQVRNLQAEFDKKQQFILHQMQRQKHSHQVQKNQIIKGFQQELNKSTMRFQSNQRNTRPHIQSMLRNLKKEIDMNKRALISLH